MLKDIYTVLMNDYTLVDAARNFLAALKKTDDANLAATFQRLATEANGEDLGSHINPKAALAEAIQREVARRGVELEGIDADEANPEACPGCGCLPGDGRTNGCRDAIGCGFEPLTLNDLRPGTLLTSDEVESLFGAEVARNGGGWDKGRKVYVTTQFARPGEMGWRVGEVHGTRASWNF